MKSKKIRSLLLVLLLPLAAVAAPLVPGTQVPALVLEDQHGKTVSVGAPGRANAMLCKSCQWSHCTSHKASPGKARISPMRSASLSKNGSTPRKLSPSGTVRAMPLTT